MTPTATFHTGSVAKSYNKNQFKGNQSKSQNKINKSCTFCQQSHSSVDCINITDKDKRYAIVKQKRLCFNCLGNHKVSECKSRYKCRTCEKKHHTSLCDRNKQQNDLSSSNEMRASVNTVDIEQHSLVMGSENTSTFYTSSSVESRTEVLLKTAVAPVWSGNLSVPANILLDEGSQKTFVTENLAEKLKLRPIGTANISLAAFGDANRNIRYLDKAIIDLETQNGTKIPMEVLIVPTIAAPLDNRINFEASKLPYLQGLKLAHPVCNEDKFDISMLIGADYFWDIVQDQIVRGHGPTAVKSHLGYLLSGPLSTGINSTNSASMLNILIQHKKEECNLE